MACVALPVGLPAPSLILSHAAPPFAPLVPVSLVSLLFLQVHSYPGAFALAVLTAWNIHA